MLKEPRKEQDDQADELDGQSYGIHGIYDLGVQHDSCPLRIKVAKSHSYWYPIEPFYHILNVADVLNWMLSTYPYDCYICLWGILTRLPLPPQPDEC